MQDTRAWRWIPTLYFAQGFPYAIVIAVSIVMYKSLGVSNTDVALYTSWLYLPWVVKPFWAPMVDLLGTKRAWTLGAQLVIACALALAAASLPLDRFLAASLAMLWLTAFASATHDIAADGFYMLGLPQPAQAGFVGVRSAFWRLSQIAGQGGLVYFAGRLAETSASVAVAWSTVLFAAAAAMVAIAAWHRVVLPRSPADVAVAHGSLAAGFRDSLAAFFRRPGIGRILAFLLLFRLAEAQALKLATPFLLDPRAVGGLGLTTSEAGIAYGTVGVIALTAGGLLGGWCIRCHGLRAWLWPMALAMHVPNLLFVYLAHAQPESFAVVSAAIAVEQFGYGFGFCAFLLYMVMVVDGPHRASHYALCTGFMALGMMIPGMASGWIQERLGYADFFAWICIATIPSFIVVARVHIDPGFGRKPAPS